jgi:polyisoprenoid-binding protein YceI
MARYLFDPRRSRVWIDARSNVHPIHADVDGVEGYVDLERRDDHVDLGVKPAGRLSLAVERLKSGNALEDRELQRRIDARRFRTIDGALVNIQETDHDTRFRVQGDLTFRGVTRRYTDEMELRVIDGGLTVELRGATTFDIRDFGMKPPRILMLRVEPHVAVRVELVGVRE